MEPIQADMAAERGRLKQIIERLQRWRRYALVVHPEQARLLQTS